MVLIKPNKLLASDVPNIFSNDKIIYKGLYTLTDAKYT